MASLTTPQENKTNISHAIKQSKTAQDFAHQEPLTMVLLCILFQQIHTVEAQKKHSSLIFSLNCRERNFAKRKFL